MASAIICLATNQKFNFSKYIFESMVKNFDNASKFLMYPRFVQVFLDKQLEGMSSHKKIYVTPSHTKKIFGNMKRVGKGFSGRETPLFPTMVVQNQAEMGEGSAIPTDPYHTPTIIQPSTSQPQKKQRSRRTKRKDTKVPQPSGLTTNVADEAIYKKRDDSLERDATPTTGLDAKQDRGGSPRRQETMGDTIAQTRSENVSKFSNDPLIIRGNTLQSGEDRLKVQELMELCTNLQNRVIDLKKTKTAQAQEITSFKLRVKKLENKGGSRIYKLKRLYKVGRSTRIVSSDEASLGDQEDASKQERKIDDIDKDVEIILVDETQGRYGDDIMFDVSDLAGEEVFVAKQGVSDKDLNLSVNEVTLAQALAALKSANAKGLVIHEEEQATTPTVSSQQPSQAKIQDKALREKKETLCSKKSRKEKEQTTNKSSTKEYHVIELVKGSSEKAEVEIAQERSSKRAGDELEQEKEVVVNAIPLATKPPSIVDWKIHKEGNKSYYQIIRADGSLKMYLVFSHMLKSFDREDLETLYKLVKAKYGST
ncbi:hypothetical protein Tco_0312850 [Tanacetum coccineum]